MSAIFLIHFWGASSSKPGNLDFNHAEQMRIKNKHGGLHNHRICNGGDSKTLANKTGVLAVQCLNNNCNTDPLENPASGYTYEIDISVPKNTDNDNSVDQNDGINILLEINICKDPNVTIIDTTSATIIGVSDVTAGTILETFSV
jgi:hypothetical protein